MKANVGIVEMKGTSGTAQNLSGSWFVGRNISTLVNANNTGITVAATLNDSLLISSALLYGSVNNSLITTNDNVTLLSRDSSTARFGEIVTGSGNAIEGKMNIERYMYAKKSWRLLATPINISTSPTVTTAWRESAVNTMSTGYGTQITGPATFIGMDSYTQRASMKYFDASLNNFIDVNNTNTAVLANTKGYFVFVRGDRAVPITGAAGTTILRMKGNVLTGNQTFPVSPLAFESVGNPFASRIDFRTITKTNIANSFIAWNPNSAGMYNVGAYETYAFNGTNYVKAGGVIRNFIESGEAFYIQSNTAVAGSLVVKESDKGGGSSMQSRVNVNLPTLEVYLLASNADSSFYVADGVLINFDSSYSSGFDNDDVRKFLNTYDNIFVPLMGHKLFANRRPPLENIDMIPLSINSMRQASYQLKIDATALHTNGISGFLKDGFLGTETQLNLEAVNSIDFKITQDPASSDSLRFVLLFRPVEVLSVKFINILANRNNNINSVEWISSHENNIDKYIVQYSETGRNFTDIAQLPSTGNSGKLQKYKYDHVVADALNMHYRILAKGVNGLSILSDTVKLKLGVEHDGISIFSNPVTNKTFVVYLNKQLPGQYKISVCNLLGEQLYQTSLDLSFGNAYKTIVLPAHIGTGNYVVNTIDEMGNSTSIKLTVY